MVCQEVQACLLRSVRWNQAAYLVKVFWRVLEAQAAYAPEQQSSSCGQLHIPGLQTADTTKQAKKTKIYTTVKITQVLEFSQINGMLNFLRRPRTTESTCLLDGEFCHIHQYCILGSSCQPFEKSYCPQVNVLCVWPGEPVQHGDYRTL